MDLSTVVAKLHGYTRDAVVICDAEPVDEPGPVIIFVNEAFTLQTGYSSEEVLGKTPRILQGIGTDKTVTKRISDQLKGWQDVREVLLNYRKDGTEFWTDISIVPVADKTGWFKYWVSVQRDITEVIKGQNKLAEQAIALAHAAHHDALTGLLNRFGFDRAVEAIPNQSGQIYSLFQIDLDRFKFINDRLGHHAGDEVLKNVGLRFKSLHNETTCIARTGGDEFIVVRPHQSQSDDQHFADHLVRFVGQEVKYHEHSCRFGVSVGWAVGTWKEIVSETLSIKADMALYRSKSEGRSRATAFTNSMLHELADKQSLSADFELALQRNELVAHFMPQVDCKSLATTAYEALARWQHPSMGILGPDRFLHIAKGLKVEHDLDQRILKNAIHAQRQFSAYHGCAVSVSVNVSPKRLSDRRLLKEVRELDIAPGTISFELLETVFLDDPGGEVMYTLDGLREIGIGIEIDDFGTGHASLLALMRVRPDRIKIDRSLVTPITKSKEYRKLVQSIIEVGDVLGTPVVAEGVETVDHVEILQDLKCSYLQGHYFGTAQPLMDLTCKVAAFQTASPGC
jgi:diguanylate cyclase (GGDEF)-like protein/PAS domain S-box-containing protein